MGNFLTTPTLQGSPSHSPNFHTNSSFSKESLLNTHNEERQKASEHARKRGEFLSRSQQAYQAGDKAEASRLSTLGKKEGEAMKEANEKAANAIFAYYNFGRTIYELDLHQLYVEEAIEKLNIRLQEIQGMHQEPEEGMMGCGFFVLLCGGLSSPRSTDPKQDLLIIVGRGNHSVNAIPKLKPAVERELRSRGITFTLENDGCFRAKGISLGG